MTYARLLEKSELFKNSDDASDSPSLKTDSEVDTHVYDRLDDSTDVSQVSTRDIQLLPKGKKIRAEQEAEARAEAKRKAEEEAKKLADAKAREEAAKKIEAKKPKSAADEELEAQMKEESEAYVAELGNPNEVAAKLKKAIAEEKAAEAARVKALEDRRKFDEEDYVACMEDSNRRLSKIDIINAINQVENTYLTYSKDGMIEFKVVASIFLNLWQTVFFMGNRDRRGVALARGTLGGILNVFDVLKLYVRKHQLYNNTFFLPEVLAQIYEVERDLLAVIYRKNIALVEQLDKNDMALEKQQMSLKWRCKSIETMMVRRNAGRQMLRSAEFLQNPEVPIIQDDLLSELWERYRKHLNRSEISTSASFNRITASSSLAVTATNSTALNTVSQSSSSYHARNITVERKIADADLWQPGVILSVPITSNNPLTKFFSQSSSVLASSTSSTSPTSSGQQSYWPPTFGQRPGDPSQ